MSNERELVDLVDANGEIKEIGVPRNEIDKRLGHYLQIVIAVVFDESGKVLVQKRALTKSTCPGDLDHTCGAIKSGETPEEATTREALEETGLKFEDLKIIGQKLNGYSRYRYLIVGKSNGEPNSYDPNEVEWVKFISIEDLKSGQKTGKYTFVDDFFEDLELVLGSRN